MYWNASIVDEMRWYIRWCKKTKTATCEWEMHIYACYIMSCGKETFLLCSLIGYKWSLGWFWSTMMLMRFLSPISDCVTFDRKH